MSDLAAFLRARLDEDERDSYATHLWECASLNVNQDALCTCGYPARVLREVEAKRAILDEHPRMNPGVCRTCQHDDWVQRRRVDTPWPCPTLHQLAAVCSDHPDYRQEWAP